MEGNSIKTFENLCKIFEMRIKLDREQGKSISPEILANYEKYLKKIDLFYNKEFEERIKTLIATESTLEKEKERLEKLIRLIEERIEKRETLENTYNITTGKDIDCLQTIISDSEFNNKKERLNLITKYLDTTDEIEGVKESIIALEKSLLEEETKKDEYTSKNIILEDELYSTFISIIKEDEYYCNINEENLNDELNNIIDKVTETKETLDITKDSISSLKINGLEDDYTTYIEDAEKSYYIWKEREILLRIFSIILNFEEEFTNIYSKRNKIKEYLDERQDLRKKLKINDIDILLDLEKIILEQFKVIDNEKEILENISNYSNRIKFKKDRLSELEEINNSVEILAILSEYKIIETYDSEDYSESEEELIEEENIKEEPIIKEVINPYRIVEIKDYPKTLNIGLAKLKGENIRDKVNKKLNPIKEEKTFEDITIDIDKDETKNKELVEEKETVIEKVKEDIIEKNESSDIEDSKLVWEIPLNIAVDNLNEEKEEPNIDKKEDMPVWNMPLDIKTDKITEENKKEEKNNIPIWGDITPTENEIEDISSIKTIKKEPELEEKTIDNIFWIPVSEEKLDTNKFPNINIPIQNNFTNKEDNFGFPDIK